MSLPNTTGAIIATGFNCHMQVIIEGGAWETVGLVASFQANEDFQAQEAVVMGNLGPITIDPQGYTCNISVDGFLPAKAQEATDQLYQSGGDPSTRPLINVVPDRTEFMNEAGMPKIRGLRFWNRRSGETLAEFTGVLVTSNGVNVDGNAYVRNNVEMRALSWDKPIRA